MVVKTVIKWIINILVGCCFITPLAAQSGGTKYVLFDQQKDSIVTRGGTSFYKIDGNLFDINHYNEIDTINRIKEIQFNSVKQLWVGGEYIMQNYLNQLKVDEPIIVEKSGIETFNDLFLYIFIIEKLPGCKYKRSRVWWIDY